MVLLISDSTVCEKEFAFLRWSSKKDNVIFEIVLKYLLLLQFPDSLTIADKQLKSSCCAESILNMHLSPESFSEKE